MSGTIPGAADEGLGEISVMLCQADDYRNGMEVTVFDDDQPILEVGIIDLVEEWAELESLDGHLYPALDATLNVLGDLTFALIKVVERLPDDDPHRADLLKVYTIAYDYTQRLVEAIR